LETPLDPPLQDVVEVCAASYTLGTNRRLKVKHGVADRIFLGRERVQQVWVGEGAGV
jgi:hypothetical protein